MFDDNTRAPCPACAPKEEEEDAFDEVRPCVCGCRRSKHQGERVDGECADCMGYCKKWEPPPDDGCPDCNDGILTRAFQVPHDIPCPTCKGTMKVPPDDGCGDGRKP